MKTFNVLEYVLEQLKEYLQHRYTGTILLLIQQYGIWLISISYLSISRKSIHDSRHNLICALLHILNISHLHIKIQSAMYLVVGNSTEKLQFQTQNLGETYQRRHSK